VNTFYGIQQLVRLNDHLSFALVLKSSSLQHLPKVGKGSSLLEIHTQFHHQSKPRNAAFLEREFHTMNPECDSLWPGFHRETSKNRTISSAMLEADRLQWNTPCFFVSLGIASHLVSFRQVTFPSPVGVGVLD
jgi:hypothetical protein